MTTISLVVNGIMRIVVVGLSNALITSMFVGRVVTQRVTTMIHDWCESYTAGSVAGVGVE